MKRATASGVAGSPVKSNANRRAKVARSAAGLGASPASACFAAMKPSIGCSLQSLIGADGLVGLMKAQ